MTNLRKITEWEFFDARHGQWYHSHIEEGHSYGVSPTADSEDQYILWKGRKWRKVHSYIDDNSVITRKLSEEKEYG